MDEVPIFLDARQGRYFLLRGEMARSFFAFASGHASPSQIETLAQHRLVEPDAPPRKTESEAMPASASYIDGSLPRVSARLAGEAVLRQWSAKLTLRRRGFARVVRDLEKAQALRKKRPHQVPGASEAAIAAAFLQAQRFISAADQCLPRSLAMAAMLDSLGHTPTVVMGVQLPFAAHCWVQCENRVVSDPLERIADFKPILAL
ncbi:lasso peptide biosynthesis B2 protein [Sphingobium sp. GW456-12-10-14-TSB1]|uniref:lasso peptide biosynthesis B2 protein n=1 Tax=Sphingobium sp. GW456-12-10-14-TSB1 TaxID=1987165 RepID=UPI0015947D73|nr:lasso peptide biosynthesis B2 protein [Sphingobium sp. GW456-12-10-14-TSB1]